MLINLNLSLKTRNCCVVLCLQETCWKPYLSKRSQTQNNDDDDDDDICSSVEDTEAAVYLCLQQYIQHYINVCVDSMLCFFLSHLI